MRSLSRQSSQHASAVHDFVNSCLLANMLQGSLLVLQRFANEDPRCHIITLTSVSKTGMNVMHVDDVITCVNVGSKIKSSSLRCVRSR